MANKLLKTRMQQKIDTSQNWAKATNFVPLKGEICIYSDLQGQVKIGDGTSKIGDLNFSRETFIYTLTVNEAGVPTFSSDYATVLNVINKGFYDVRLSYTPTSSNDFIYIPFTNKGTSWLDFSCTVDGILYEARLGAVDSSFRTQKLEPLVGSTDDTTPTQVKEALLEGRPISISITDSTYGKLTFTSFAFGKTTGSIAANMVAMYNHKYLLYELLGDTSNNQWHSLTTTVASTDIATTSKDGLMSSADKTKLDGIAEGANKTIVDTELSTTSENPVQNKIINSALNGKADKDHTHNYAGSSSAGGAANSANKLNTNAGSAINPVYFANGVPVKTTYTLEKSVPSDAKFTDTVTEVDATLTAGGTNPVQGGAIKSYIDGKTAGLTGAMHFIGKATVDIADGSTTDPAISGYTTKAKGDVILGKDDHKEFVWDGNKWELLGDEGSYVLNTIKINKKPLSGDITLTAADVGAATTNDITTEIGKLDANEVGGTGKYIQSIQQTDGKISATAGTMPTALKNPNALTFTGAVTGTYDGSAAKTVNIPAAITVDEALSNTSTNPVQNKAVKAELDAKISKSGDTFNGELTYLGTDESAINLGGNGGIWNAKSLQFSGLFNKINITPLSDAIGLKLLSNDNTDVIVSGIATPTSDNHAVNKQYVDNKVPNTTTSDNNKFLRVVNGVPSWVALINVAEEGA